MKIVDAKVDRYRSNEIRNYEGVNGSFLWMESLAAAGSE